MAKKSKNEKLAGILVPAGCLIGLGIGMVYGNIAAGVLIGLGCGFLGMFITMLALRKK